MSEARTLNYATPEARPLTDAAITAASTLAGVALLVAMGKGIAAAGDAMDLPNACWQLLTARAVAGALVVSTLVTIRRDMLALFGIAYGAAMLMSHGGPMLLMWCTLAGLATWGVRALTRSRVQGFLAIVIPTLTFALVMTGGSLVRAIERGTQLDYLRDAGIRAAVTVLTALAVFGVAKAVRRSMR
jgi:hypothetical protein